MGYNIEILTKKDNFFVMSHVYVYNSLQKVSKKNIAYFIISESVKFLVKKYYREVIQMHSKILLYTIRGKWVSHESFLTDHFF